MDVENKIKLVTIAYENAQKILNDVKKEPPRRWGMAERELAKRTVEEFKWLVDDTEKELPHPIMKMLTVS